jgi:hypothetical protein
MPIYELPPERRVEPPDFIDRRHANTPLWLLYVQTWPIMSGVDWKQWIDKAQIGWAKHDAMLADSPFIVRWG